MVNEILKTVTVQQMPARISETNQIVNIEAAKTSMNPESLSAHVKDLPQQVDRSKIEAVVSSINNLMQNVQRDLTFNMDEESGQAVIKVYDVDSGELVRQIPTEDVLAIATYFQDNKENPTIVDKMPKGMLFSGSI